MQEESIFIRARIHELGAQTEKNGMAGNALPNSEQGPNIFSALS